MSHVVIETTVPVVVTSDDAHEPTVVVNAVQTTTVFVESAPEVIEVNAGPRGLPGLPGPKGEKGDAGGVPDAPLDGAAYARQSGAWVEALAASARGAAGGVASLDANGKLPESQVPAIAITDVYPVGNEAGMLALDAQRGDIAVRGDINKSFVLQTEPASILANWLELRTPTDAVLSVAGKTGAVSLVPSDITGLDTALAGKADNSVALTDAAATATLPATAAASVASRLQVLRNNVKQAFADLGNKLNTDFAGLTARTIDGTETLALSGGLKATVQAVLNWVLGRANTWTGTQTFNKAVFTPTAVLSTAAATTYTSGTWYAMPGTAPILSITEHATYVADLHVQYSSSGHHQYTGSCTLSTVGWKASGSIVETSFALEQHAGNSITASVRPTVSNGARGFEFRFGGDITVASGGFVRLTLLRLI